MNPPAVRPAWGCSASVFDQLAAQPSDDSGNRSLTLRDWSRDESNYKGRSQIATDASSQALLPFNPQPYSTSNLRYSLVRCWRVDYPVSSSAGHFPDADLPLSVVDAGRHFPVNGQSFQQNVLFCPRPMTTADFSPIPSTYGDTSHKPLSDLGQAPTASDARAVQRLETTSRRCIKFRALKKPVILFIREHLNRRLTLY